MGERVKGGEFSEREILPETMEGIPPWFKQIEEKIRESSFPEITFGEGRALAKAFEENGVFIGGEEFAFTQPEKTTEGPLMRAIEQDLMAILGITKEEIEKFVKELIQPLRGGGKKEEVNKFLVMAVENVLMDVLATVRAFQGGDKEWQNAALSNLALSLSTRIRKGEAREQGYCSKQMHREGIWHLRGVRDLPPGSLEEIGNFLAKTLEKNGKEEIEAKFSEEEGEKGRVVISRYGTGEGVVAGLITTELVDNERVLKRIIDHLNEGLPEEERVSPPSFLADSLRAIERGEEERISFARWEIIPARGGYYLKKDGKALSFEEAVKFLEDVLGK